MRYFGSLLFCGRLAPSQPPPGQIQEACAAKLCRLGLLQFTGSSPVNLLAVDHFIRAVLLSLT